MKAKIECVYDTNGNILTIDEDTNEYSWIPEHCEECHCAQGEPNYKDYTGKSVHVCEQCGTEYKLSFLT